MEKTKKQILTKELIEKDIYEKYIKKKHIGESCFLVILGVVLIIFGISILCDFSGFKDILYSILLFFFGSLSVCAVGWSVYNIIMIDSMLKKSDYQIVIDYIINKKREGAYPPGSGSTFRLYFQRYGHFASPASVIFGTDDEAVFNVTEIGDQFHLVVKGKRILCAYNTKIYELSI